MVNLTFGSVLASLVASVLAAQPSQEYFHIDVVDPSTGRGVPLVELRTTNELRFYSDSSGAIAIDEPALIGHEVFFHVSSHGYEFPADGFGYRGFRVKLTAGGRMQIAITRHNVAERLYRITGEGIYRDSVLVGKPVPIEQPLLNAGVMGQDSALAVPYRGKIYWIWGDTSYARYPLGNFGASGARSDWPPPRGTGLDPAIGINLSYFVNDSGLSRPMVTNDAVPGPGAKWLSGLTNLKDQQGQERLIAKYVRVKDLGSTYERGIVQFNDETASFDKLKQFNLDSPLYLDGHPTRVRADQVPYLYCGFSVPYAVRVRADIAAVLDTDQYEGFSPLVPRTRYGKAATQLDRAPDGTVHYGWKANTPPISDAEQQELMELGVLKPDEVWPAVHDIDTGAPIRLHAGTLRWNGYRQRWLMIAQQSFGSSNLGEIWYAESPTPTGPWGYARKIVTHEKYTFYNPVHHSFFDQDRGRLIYFEGTYSDLFAGSPFRTPRYDYNQMMYRLALDDERLFLPSPVYEIAGAGTPVRYATGNLNENDRRNVRRVAFYAMEPDRKRRAMIAVYRGAGSRLQLDSPDNDATLRPMFYALPHDGTKQSPPVAALYEYQDGSGNWIYSTDRRLAAAGVRRSAEPVCMVWPRTTSVMAFDSAAAPDTD